SVLPSAPVPFSIAAHPTKPIVYVSCFGTQVVEYRDARTGAYLNGSAENSSVPVGSGARNLVVDPRTDTLYVSSFDAGTVLALDAQTGIPQFSSRDASTLPVGRGPRAMALLAAEAHP